MDQVAVVTGGRGAIGSAIARALRADGFAVATWDVTPPDAAAPAALDVDCDVSDQDAADGAAALTEERLGPVSVLVNAVGVAQLRDLFVDVPAADWDRIVAVNLFGPVHAMRALVPGMRRLGHGVIVNLCSIWSTTATAKFRSAYIASKWALLGATKAIATELVDDGIRVCAVSPGPVDTPMTAGLAPPEVRRRWMTADDVAAAVRFAVSPAAAPVVGSELQLFGQARPDPGV
jgi:NAD(P)-dependent dehydrogenase (short-subunit alcohol dehydrogenase family)